MQSKNGFTLIELLVVISVVSFFSAVSITAFNASRVKSVDTTKVIGVKTYAQILNQIYFDTGKYPDPDGESGARYTTYCLGNPSSGHCLSLGSSEVDSALNAILDKYVMNNKLIDVPRIGNGTIIGGYNDLNEFSGLLYRCQHYSPDNTCLDVKVAWIAEPSSTAEAGAAACKIPNSFCENNYFGFTKCSLILEYGEIARPSASYVCNSF